MQLLPSVKGKIYPTMKVWLGQLSGYFRHTYLGSNDFSELIRQRMDLFLTLTFNHDSRERLGTRIPQEQAAAVAERSLDFPRLTFDWRNIREGNFLANRDIYQDLRIAGKSFCQLI